MQAITATRQAYNENNYPRRDRETDAQPAQLLRRHLCHIRNDGIPFVTTDNTLYLSNVFVVMELQRIVFTPGHSH